MMNFYYEETDDIMNEPIEEDLPKPESDSDKDDKSPNAENEIISIKPTRVPSAINDDKNGVRRKNLYIAFIEWCKAYNIKNNFGSIFDKDAFHVTYPFIPEEMRYFYRLANPMLCVLGGKLTFFPVSELRKINVDNHKLNEMLIFAATDTDLRIFSKIDKKVYLGIVDDDKEIQLTKVLGNTFDEYIQTMIGGDDILNAPLEEKKPKEDKNADTDNINESVDSKLPPIRPLTVSDTTNPYFVKWLFEEDEFENDIPEKFDFNILIHNPKIGLYAYGYFINNKLEGIIKIRKHSNNEYYSISMLFVNKNSQGNGIGQSLLEYTINKFGDNEIRLNVFDGNKIAMHIYNKFGFEIYSNFIITDEDVGNDNDLIGKKAYKLVRCPSHASKPSIINESSHGKLQFDFRLAYDYDTGHKLKIVYALDNIDIVGVGDFYLQSKGYDKGETYDDYLNYARKNISSKGNLDHNSKGQKILAIVDMITGKKLSSVKCINPYCPGINGRASIQPDIETIQQEATKDPDKFIATLKVGEIDNTPRFKSTHWPTRNDLTNKDGEDITWRRICKGEIYKDGRGKKIGNMISDDLVVDGDKYNIFLNPNKKQALTELFGKEKQIFKALDKLPKDSTDPDIINKRAKIVKLWHIVNNDIKTIKGSSTYDVSIMKKYHKKYIKESEDNLFTLKIFD